MIKKRTKRDQGGTNQSDNDVPNKRIKSEKSDFVKFCSENLQFPNYLPPNGKLFKSLIF